MRPLAALAPLVFVIHVLEEGPGFVTWFNAHVSRAITPGLFWTVNVSGLAITLGAAILSWVAPGRLSAFVLFAWLSFLFAANALLHLAAAVVDRGYVPGLVSAIALYLPFYAMLARRVHRTTGIGVALLITTGLAAGAPMLVHGYLILFRGSRLF